MKKIIACIAVLAVLAGSVARFNQYQKSIESNAGEIAKEITVERGTITAGVTESAAVNVESLEQTYDLTLTNFSISASVENNASSGGMGMVGNMGNMAGMGGMSSMNSNGNKGSTNVTTASDSSDVELVVDTVYITEGQTVSAGDVIMTLTEESISEARTALEQAVSDAELALKQAQIEESETLLSAKYDYDTRIAEGSTAESVYSATLEEIASNISSLKNQISDLETQISECTNDSQLSQLNTQLESYQSQLSSAESTRSSDELSAKQTYEEALMYYENAQSLYDVAVNDIGKSTEQAQEAVDSAKEDLDTFNAYVSDGSIRAEYSGTITGVGYSSGDTLNADTAVASYADAESITVTVNVTEDDISAVNLNDTVDISFLSYPDEVYHGYVSEIGSSSSSGNTSTVSYPVTVIITEFPEKLLSGMTANGGIGIMNVLFVSVKERTKEIGILKAIGGSRKDILLEFMMEACCISMIGGVIGVGLSFAVSPILTSFSIRLEMSIAGAVLALVFSLVTGTVFGFYPAWKASKLVPVEALSTE